VRLRLATLGGLPPGKNGCNAPRLIHIDYAYITGTRWRTTRGLRVGDTVEDLHALYPNAIFQRRRIGNWPAPAYWILHVRERCFIGICESRYQTVPRLTTEIRGGRVVAFFFPVGAQGE
jgi:molybdopterin converting factor small subunit